MPPAIGRRLFVRDLGRGAVAVAVLGLAACGDDDEPDARTSSTTTTASTTSTTTGPSADDGEPDDATVDLRWQQVSLGFVSAYVLARGNVAAVVDTGTAGSEDQIAGGLAAVGLGWDDVRHLVLTHRHPDHQGSAPAVLAQAPAATAYAGRADVEAIVGIDVTPLDDGADVFGLQVVATPGHTPGHISVFDPATRLLVAGDALNGAGDGAIEGPNPQFSTDHDLALAQVAKLAALAPDTVLFGHGDPVVTGAAAALDAIG